MELRSRQLSSDPATPSRSTSTSKRSPQGKPRSPSKPSYPLWRVIAGWAVHSYTAMGLLINMYSLLYAIFAPTPDFSLFAKLNWLAILVDATDGTFARAIDVKKVVPTYDGALLDNIIDFQTFALLPALAVIRFELIEGARLQFALASVALVSSAYAFCQTLAKTSEAFVGFPSYWNIVVFYVYYLRTSAPVTIALFLVCGILSFVPIHFIYPTRTVAFFHINLWGAYVWATLLLVPTLFPDSKYVTLSLRVSFMYVIYYFAMSVYLDQRRRKLEA